MDNDGTPGVLPHGHINVLQGEVAICTLSQSWSLQGCACSNEKELTSNFKKTSGWRIEQHIPQ